MKRVTIIAMLLLVGTTAAFAQHMRRGAGPGMAGGATMGPGAGAPSDVLATYLVLTAEQLASWQAIQEETRTQMQTLMDQQQALHEQLQTALEGTDATAIGTLMLKIRDLRAQCDALRAAADAKLVALLTPEQKVKFDAMQAALEFLRQQGPGPGAGPGSGPGAGGPGQGPGGPMGGRG